MNPFLIIKQDSVITTESFKMVVPSRWVKIGLIRFEAEEIKVLGVVELISENKRYTMLTPAMLGILPSAIETEVIDGKEFTVFKFEKGTTFLKSTKILKDDSFVFSIFEEFVIKGNIPYYIDRESFIAIFNKLPGLTGTNTISNIAVIEMLASIIFRDENNEYLRYIDNPKSFKVVGLGDVGSAFKNTIPKITGNYFKTGLRSAILEPEKTGTDSNDIFYS